MDSATRRGAAFGLLEQTTERPGLEHVVHLPVLSLIGRALRRFRPIITVAKPEKEGNVSPLDPPRSNRLGTPLHNTSDSPGEKSTDTVRSFGKTSR